MAEPDELDTLTAGGSVTPERFARIRTLFEAALEHRPSERQAYLEAACGGDGILLEEVAGMLRAEANGDVLLKTPLSTSTPEEGRFPAGTILAGRYKILGLLGRGGMGEVYKAFDLILNQIVALKFLTPTLFSEGSLVRFRNEVRVARQVSHPNVCRVYDLGMVEGLHFFSMEFIDGEDLASLLRRIGRLPQDKAVEFTRKICAGLSAAHERGVLHRDLKPANIMIDGRGQPRITDFGLAGLAAEIPLSDLRSGTPAYLSPEQKAGKDVSTRSDLYSLGLVLHEMFTGKRRGDSQGSPIELVKDLDPVIERVILRCLDDDPKRRPSSALALAMALPGADPIAAALAAGETPSPEMVAASQEKEGISHRAAILCFAATLVMAIAVPVLGRACFPLAATLEIPPDGLAFKAQEILSNLGYPQKPRDSAYGFEHLNPEYEADLRQRLPPSESLALLSTNQPATTIFWYRQHDALLELGSFFPGPGVPPGAITYREPGNDVPGMIRLRLDPAGRLIQLEVRPENRPVGISISPTVDWAVLFRAAQMDATRFAPAQAEFVPPMAFDARAAFTGTFAEGRAEVVRLEAASWQGRLVYFNLSGDWARPERGNSLAPGQQMVLSLILLLISLGSATLAWQNWRQGRGDGRGAVWVAGVTFPTVLMAALFGTSFVPSVWSVGLIAMGLSYAGLSGGLVFILYLAVEPFVRRHWPDSLISLTRLQSGRLRDALIASHILTGLAALSVFEVGDLAIELAGGQHPGQVTSDLLGLSSVPDFLAFLFGNLGNAILVVMGYCLIVALFRSVLLPLLENRVWIADSAAVTLLALQSVDGTMAQRIAIHSVLVLSYIVILWLFRRYGLLAGATFVMVSALLSVVPPVIPSWWSGRVLFLHAIPIALGMWALWVILTGNRHSSIEPAG